MEIINQLRKLNSVIPQLKIKALRQVRQRKLREEKKRTCMYKIQYILFHLNRVI